MPTYKFQVGDLVRIRADVTEEQLRGYGLQEYAPGQGRIEYVRDPANYNGPLALHRELQNYIRRMPYVIDGWVYPEHILEHACRNWQLHRELRRAAAATEAASTRVDRSAYLTGMTESLEVR